METNLVFLKKISKKTLTYLKNIYIIPCVTENLLKRVGG